MCIRDSNICSSRSLLVQYYGSTEMRLQFGIKSTAKNSFTINNDNSYQYTTVNGYQLLQSTNNSGGVHGHICQTTCASANICKFLSYTNACVVELE